MQGPSRQIVRLLIFILCYGSTSLMYRPLVPLYLESLGVSALGVGVVVSAYSLVPALLSLWAARIISAVTIRSLLGAGSVMVMTGCATLALFTDLPLLFLGQLVSGASAILVIVGAQSYIQQVSRPADLARNFSFRCHRSDSWRRPGSRHGLQACICRHRRVRAGGHCG